MTMSNSKRLIFTLITLSIPILFFVVLEFALRLAGYGKSMPLFIENPPAPQYLLPRPDVVKRYFSDPELAPNVTIETNFFLKDKPSDGIRIFVQGGSTAAGFPYGFGASIAGMLDYRLKQSFPDNHVEVINTALSAVNSYTILDFVDEIIEQQPDAVLIYAGHNEFLGVLGVGSNYTAAGSRGATLLYLKLKDLRIFQLMQKLYAWFSLPDEAILSETNARTMMAKVAKHKNIPVDSELFSQGVSQFDANLDLILAKYQNANIPVFISTIASNLSDQAPFSSAEYSTDIENLLNDLTDGNADIQRAKSALEKVVAEQSADASFKFGKVLQSQGLHELAKEAYVNAKQHDLLRFRAPVEMNQIIRKKSANVGVHLVEVQKAMKQAAKNGVIGNDLMLEHLHPNIDGYFVIADAFYNELRTSNIFGEFPRPISSFNARLELPVFDAELYWGEAKIAALMADYPFQSSPQQPQFKPQITWSDRLGFAAYKKRADWLTIASETLRRSQGKDLNTQLKAAKLLSDAVPYNEQYAYQAGMLLMQNKRWLEAPRYLKRVLDINEENTNAMLALAHAYSVQQRLDLTKQWLQKVLKISPNNPTALKVLKQLGQ
ncbi:MAG: hypothetical protein HWE10_13055 [Gammaproteobacteria bacterium]|nr:hypothetical protein [Gammaproteobacteria bacterium]